MLRQTCLQKSNIESDSLLKQVYVTLPEIGN